MLREPSCTRAGSRTTLRRCGAGEWEPDWRLPAVAELAKHSGIARNTVMKGLCRLSEDVLVEIVPSWERFGRGTKASARHDG